jgi:hypothetical protein
MYDIMVELLDDEENEVKYLAIEGFFNNIHRFTEKKVVDSCIELVIDLIKSETNKELIIDCIGVAILNSEVMRTHFGSKEYLEHENIDLRNKVIYNSHILIKTLGIEYFMESIHPQYERLLTDEDENVRAKIAENIHELIIEFGTIIAYNYGFDRHVTTLMHDKSSSVGGALLANFDQIVEILLPDELTEDMVDEEIEKKAKTFKIILCKNLIKMEEVVKNNWRHLTRWIDCVYKIITIYDSSTIVKKIIPIIVTHLKKSGRETRRF